MSLKRWQQGLPHLALYGQVILCMHLLAPYCMLTIPAVEFTSFVCGQRSVYHPRTGTAGCQNLVGVCWVLFRGLGALAQYSWSPSTHFKLSQHSIYQRRSCCGMCCNVARGIWVHLGVCRGSGIVCKCSAGAHLAVHACQHSSAEACYPPFTRCLPEGLPADGHVAAGVSFCHKSST